MYYFALYFTTASIEYSLTNLDNDYVLGLPSTLTDIHVDCIIRRCFTSFLLQNTKLSYTPCYEQLLHTTACNNVSSYLVYSICKQTTIEPYQIIALVPIVIYTDFAQGSYLIVIIILSLILIVM